MTMKLGFSTLGCPQWDWAEILGTAKDMGIDGIEIRGVANEIDPMKITIFDEEHLEETRRQLSQSGIEIPMIASSVTLGENQEVKRASFRCSRQKIRLTLPQK